MQKPWYAPQWKSNKEMEYKGIGMDSGGIFLDFQKTMNIIPDSGLRLSTIMETEE